MLLASGRTPIMICPHFEIGTLEADLAGSGRDPLVAGRRRPGRAGD
jgi:hypothetical protein